MSVTAHKPSGIDLRQLLWAEGSGSCLSEDYAEAGMHRAPWGWHPAWHQLLPARAWKEDLDRIRPDQSYRARFPARRSGHLLLTPSTTLRLRALEVRASHHR